MLGWHTIPATVVELADVDRHLAGIDENLIRNDLTPLERSEHLAARKGWYEAKHPETKRGVAGARASNVAQKKGDATAESAVASFATDTAVKTGASERTVREDVQIAESIPEDVREAIRDTPLAASWKPPGQMTGVLVP